MKPTQPKMLIRPTDRILRSAIGFLLIIIAYTTKMSMDYFATLHICAVYLWATTLVGWDPFYAIVDKIKRVRRRNRIMDGRF